MKHEAIQLYADGCRGIYIPQFFAQTIRRELVAGVTEEQWKDLENPDSEFYLESWCDVLDNATLTIDGQMFRLHQDGDLWLVDHENANEEDLKNLFC